MDIEHNTHPSPSFSGMVPLSSSATEMVDILISLPNTIAVGLPIPRPTTPAGFVDL